MLPALRLFKALPVATHDAPATADDAVTRALLAKGCVLAPEVVASYPDPGHILTLIEQAYGRDSEALNAAFHKSFAKVRDSSQEQLVFEQLLHYWTTYGAESLGTYNQEAVYIPAERLEAPELRDDVRLVVIRGLTNDELKAELLRLLGSGIALHDRTVQDALEVATFVGLTEAELDEVRNREVQAALYDSFGLVPRDPVTFLRFVVYRATGKPLLIKNQALFDEIKGRQNLDVLRYFAIYEREVGLMRLAEIFYRYKPLFLAFRTNTRLKQTINAIRRLARHHHKPLPEDVLNSVTAHLTHRDGLAPGDLRAALARASTFRKVRLAYALKFRTTGAESILYRVRNGKSFATGFSFDNPDGARAAYDVVLASIMEELAANVRGKKVFIPAGIRYGVPATEKQFTGTLPSGTSVEVTEDLVCGIHWENQGERRIDLDLSLTSMDGKIGWDARYRDSEQGIYFSGDLTDAPLPNGASELFHIGKGAIGSWLLFVNFFNFQKDFPVPCRIMVGSERRENIAQHHTIDPNRLLAFTETVMDVQQKNLGLVVADGERTTFYFSESNLGRGISSQEGGYAEHARNYLRHYYAETIVLNDLLVAAGAALVSTPGEADLDLSPEAIDKTTILKLLSQGM